MTDRKKTAPPLEAFGVLVRETRLARRLTQQHAAKGAGVSRKQWALLEQGQNVSAVFMQKVATYLELRVIPIGDGLRATTESGGSIDVVALFNLADELLSFANTYAERLRAIAIEAVLPVSERTQDAQAIAAFIAETQEPGVEESKRLSRVIYDLASAVVIPDSGRPRTPANRVAKRRKGTR